MPNHDEPGATRSVEIRAGTVDEAIARGLVRLGGLARSEVTIEVLEEPKSGLFGFGSSEALVRLSVIGPATAAEKPPSARKPAESSVAKPPAEKPTRGASAPAAKATKVEAGAAEAAPGKTAGTRKSPAARAAKPGGATSRAKQDAPSRASGSAQRGKPSGESLESTAPIDPDQAEAAALEVLTALLERLGYPEAKIQRSTAWLPDELSEDRSLVIEVVGGGAEGLLAHDMEGLLALQFVARLLLARRADGWVNLLIDVNGDRARRVQELVSLARQSADLVEREGRPVSLPPMAPYERRVIHIALKDHASIATQSIGSGPRRKVTVRRVDQMLPEL
jgi:spoIIIJ-associated protein